MKFLVDAHLPRRLCALLDKHGHDATHTLNLSAGNHTKDSVISLISVTEQRVVISKDSDFVYSGASGFSMGRDRVPRSGSRSPS